MNATIAPYALALFCTALLASGCSSSDPKPEAEVAPQAEEEAPIASGDFEAGEPAIDEQDPTDEDEANESSDS